MRAHVEKNEGRFDKPYKDNKGILTAGVGFNVGTRDDFAKLPFQVKDADTGGVRYASTAEKRAEFGHAEAMAAEAGFHSGKNPDGTPVRNWEREARNQAAILGVSQEEGRRAVLEKYKGKETPNFDGQPVAPPKARPDQRSDVSDPAEDPSGRVQTADARDPTVMTDANPDTGPAPLAPPAPVGGLGNEAVETAKAMESEEQTANTDARIAAMRKRAAAPIEDPARSALLKPVAPVPIMAMGEVIAKSAGTDIYEPSRCP